jgi:hypothetical protein
MRGAQRPRLSNLPEWSSTAGDAAVELALVAGIDLDDWQQWVLRHALGERPDGKWSAWTVGLCVGRQNGKNEILLARELAGLFLFGERLILHTAHLQKAADTQFRRVWDTIRNTEALAGRLLRKNSSYGMQEIELRGGQRIVFGTRQGGKTGRSTTVDLVVYDEAMYVSAAQTGSIAPTMAAQSMHGNIQTWYAGSAPDELEPDHDGVPFARVRQEGLAGADRVMWAEWSVEGDEPGRVPDAVRNDPGMWALANPGLGLRISEEWVEHERDVELGRREFDRERLGVGDWPDPSEDAEHVITRDEWSAVACHDERVRPVGRRCFAVDVNPDRTWGSIGVSARRPDDLWQVAVADRRRDTGWLLKACQDFAQTFKRSQFAIDVRGPAANLIEDLRNAGLDVVEVDAGDYGRACSDFYDDVIERRLRYPWPQPELDAAVADARKKPLGDAWKWDRRNSTSADITPLVACTLALWGAKALATKPRSRVINPYDHV